MVFMYIHTFLSSVQHYCFCKQKDVLPRIANMATVVIYYESRRKFSLHIGNSVPSGRCIRVPRESTIFKRMRRNDEKTNS